MDMIHIFPFPNLKKIDVLQADKNSPVYLLMISQSNTNINLWRIHPNIEESELLDTLHVNLPSVHQVETFQIAHSWCILFGGATHSHLYSLKSSQGKTKKLIILGIHFLDCLCIRSKVVIDIYI